MAQNEFTTKNMAKSYRDALNQLAKAYRNVISKPDIRDSKKMARPSFSLPPRNRYR